MREFEFQYPNGPLIKRGLFESTIREIQESLHIQRRDMNTGWVWYELPPCTDKGVKLGISLAFFKGVLRQVTIAHIDETLYGSGWNEWSEQKEKLRAQNTAVWFAKHGYSLGSFSWGSMWADFDAKSGFGSGGVRYKET